MPTEPGPAGPGSKVIVCPYCMGTGRQDEKTGAPVGYTGDSRRCPNCGGVGTLKPSKAVF